jgi:hypothetical protein
MVNSVIEDVSCQSKSRFNSKLISRFFGDMIIGRVFLFCAVLFNVMRDEHV